MTSPLVAWVSDTHWGARGDSPVFLDFFTRFYREVFFPTLVRLGVKRIIHGGDCVDRRKFINFISAQRMKDEFFDAAFRRGIKVDVIVGNHDAPYRNTNTPNAIDTLYNMFSWGQRPSVYEDPCEVVHDWNGGSRNILYIPWINTGNYEKCFRMIGQTTAEMCVGHLELRGFSMYAGMPTIDGFDPALFSKFKRVVSGHFHHGHSDGNVTYGAAPYEITWHDYADPRGFTIIDTRDLTLQFHQNPLTIFSKVWYDDANGAPPILAAEDVKGKYVKVIVSSKKNPANFDVWMDNLHSFNPVDVQIVDDHLNAQVGDDAHILTGAEDTLQTIHKYVEAMIMQVPKEKVEGLMVNLYHKALAVEDRS